MKTISNIDNYQNINHFLNQKILFSPGKRLENKKVSFTTQFKDAYTSTEVNESSSKRLFPNNNKTFEILLPQLISKNKMNKNTIKKIDNYNIKYNYNSNISKNSNNNSTIIKRELHYIKHPWQNKSFRENEIDLFMSNCYDITKILNPIKYKDKDEIIYIRKISPIEKENKFWNLNKKEEKKLNEIKKLYEKSGKENSFSLQNDKTYSRKVKNNTIKNNIITFNRVSLSVKKEKILDIRRNYINYRNINDKNWKNKIILSNKQLLTLIESNQNNNNKSVEVVKNNNLKNNYKTIKIRKQDKNYIPSYEDRLNNFDKIRARLIFKCI